MASLLALGIFLAEVYSIQPIAAFFVSLGAFLAAVFFTVFRRLPALSNLSLSLCFGLLGLSLHTYNRQASHARVIQPETREEQIIVAGYVDVAPVSQGENYRLTVKSTGFATEAGMHRLERRFLVIAEKSLLSPFVDSLELGTFLAFSGTLQRFQGPRNPGEFDYGRYLQLNDINGLVIVRKENRMKILEGGQFSFKKVVGTVQRVFFSIIDRFHRPEHASFIKGVALGYREDISLEMKQSFIDTGTIHILAVSGSNVAVVALMFYAVFGALRVSKRAVTTLTISGLLFYMVITGLSPSVVRATIMAIVILVGLAIERKADIYNSLGVAALVLLLWDTNYLFDVGFQLSFVAVASLVYFYPVLASAIKKIPERFEEVKAIDYVLKLLAVSLAAQIGTLPFTAYYFGRISLVSVLANLVVVPVSGINTILGFVTIVFSFFSDFVAATYGALNDLLVGLLLGFVRAASHVPLAYLETAGMSRDTTALYYAVVFLVFNIQKKDAAKKALIGVLLVLNASLFSRIFAHESGKLRVTLLDVGQGDALLFELPNGKNMLLDAGPKSLRSDAGEKIVAPFLKRRGVDRLDAIVVSHPHADHAGGVAYLLRRFSVGQIIECVSSGDSLYQSLLSSARDLKVRLVKKQLGDLISLDTTCRFYVVHPLPSNDSTSNQNNSSIVLKAMYGVTSAVFAGDAEVEAEEKILRRYDGFMKSDIIKAGHHGSATSSSEAFIATVKPTTVLVSVGLKNKFRHPSPDVIARYKALGSDIHRTDEAGAIILESNGKTWTRVDWR
jgi:competence protein ComEC